MTREGKAKAAAAGAGYVLLVLSTGQFVMTLDSSVMNVSIATAAGWPFLEGVGAASPCWPVSPSSSAGAFPRNRLRQAYRLLRPKVPEAETAEAARGRVGESCTGEGSGRGRREVQPT